MFCCCCCYRNTTWRACFWSCCFTMVVFFKASWLRTICSCFTLSFSTYFAFKTSSSSLIFWSIAGFSRRNSLASIPLPRCFLGVVRSKYSVVAFFSGFTHSFQCLNSHFLCCFLICFSACCSFYYYWHSRHKSTTGRATRGVGRKRASSIYDGRRRQVMNEQSDSEIPYTPLLARYKLNDSPLPCGKINWSPLKSPQPGDK